jgi:hypothetical protein
MILLGRLPELISHFPRNLRRAPRLPLLLLIPLPTRRPTATVLRGIRFNRCRIGPMLMVDFVRIINKWSLRAYWNAHNGFVYCTLVHF